MTLRRLLVAAAGCVLLASCAQYEGAVEASREPAGASEVASPPRGSADAVWQLPHDALVSPTTQTLAVEVARVECSSGYTGTVLEPVVEETPTEVFITFTVEPLEWPDGVDSMTCEGNEWVPSTVQLSEPLGERALYDGECLPSATATAPGLCGRGGLRYSPAMAVTLEVGHCFVEPLTVAGREWQTRRTYVGYGGGLPKGFTTEGTFHVLSRRDARFASEGGATLRFEPSDGRVRSCR